MLCTVLEPQHGGMLCVSTAHKKQRQDNQELKAKLANWTQQDCLKQCIWKEGGKITVFICDCRENKDWMSVTKDDRRDSICTLCIGIPFYIVLISDRSVPISDEALCDCPFLTSR